MKPTISVVLPAYNEEANIEKICQIAVEVMERVTSDYEVIIVDDGSKDRTGEIIDRLGKENPKVRPIHHGVNKSYAKALKTGFEAARMEYAFYTDSDIQFDINEIEKLIQIIPGNDLAVGYRIDRKDPPIRIFCAGVYNALARALFGIRGVRDIDCAFKLFRRDVFKTVVIESEQFLVDTEILAKCAHYGLKVVETGVQHYPRAGGQSTVRFSHIFNTLKGMGWLKRKLAGEPRGARVHS